MMRNTAAALSVLVSASIAGATPSSAVWVNTVDAQRFGSVHLGIDNYVAVRDDASALPADFGLTIGVSPLDALQLEVGVDWWANAPAPVWLNAKASLPERGLLPAIAFGAYGVGVEDESAFHVSYVVVAKSFERVGRLSFGAYHGLGEPELFGGSDPDRPSPMRSGVLAAWERPLPELSENLSAAADLQTGESAFAAASAGVAWRLGPAASVMVGYNHMFDAALPNTLYFALDADLQLLRARDDDDRDESREEGASEPAEDADP